MSKNQHNSHHKRPSSQQYIHQRNSQIKFTQQQQQFFKNIISRFDIISKQMVSYQSTQKNLKQTKLSVDIIKQIIKSSNIKNHKQGISFNDLKKILRGIALAQNNIIPNTQNINNYQNTYTPVFYQLRQNFNNVNQNNCNFDTLLQNSKHNFLQKSSFSQKPQKSQVSNTTLNTVHTPNQSNVHNLFNQIIGSQKGHKYKCFKTQIDTSFTPQKSIKRGVSPSQVNSIPMFQTYWKNINTTHGKISGSQVKKLCQNQNNRSQLSKAWKLCNTTCKGYLTKGQFFVFLKLIRSAKFQESIPQKLTTQMQKTINKFDNKEANFKGQPLKSPSSIGSQISHLMNGNYIKTKQFKLKQQQDKKELQKLSDVLKQRTQKLNEKVEDFLSLKNQTKVSLNYLDQLQKYIKIIDQKSDKIQQQLKILRQNQNAINTRLNSACQGIKKAMDRQNNLIEQFHDQNNKIKQVNDQRIKNIAKIHVKFEQNIYNQQKSVKLQVDSIVKSQKYDEPQVSQKSVKIYRSKHQRIQSRAKQQQSRINDTQVKSYRGQQNKDIQKNTNKAKSCRLNNLKMKQSIQTLNSHYTNEKEYEDQIMDKVQKQSLTDKQKLRASAKKMSQIIDQDNILTPKQIKTLQLVNYLAPIQQNQYQVVVHKITSMNENELAKMYMRLYQQYLQHENNMQFSSELRSKIQHFNQQSKIKPSASDIMYEHSLVIQQSSIRKISNVKRSSFRKSIGYHQSYKYNNENKNSDSNIRGRRSHRQNTHTQIDQQLDTNLMDFINQQEFDEIQDID